MSASKFLSIAANGAKTLYNAIATSAGVADGSKIPMTGPNGRFDLTFMPVGIGPTTSSAIASESLAAGDMVNIFDVAGVANCRKADCSNGRSAGGYVATAFASAATVTVYAGSPNTSKTGLVPGSLYFLGTAGGISLTPPSASGSIIQEIGIALNSTTVSFDYDAPTTIA